MKITLDGASICLLFQKLIRVKTHQTKLFSSPKVNKIIIQLLLFLNFVNYNPYRLQGRSF